MYYEDKVALVTGASLGLGAMIAHRLESHYGTVIRYDIRNGHDVLKPRGFPERLDLLVNNAAVNHINWLPNVSEEEWDNVMDVNVKGIFLMTKHAHNRLKATRGTVCNIVSNAAHTPMRCSAAYNASKGAALMLSRQLARELGDDGITVFSVSPNKLAGTPMSEYIEKRVVQTRGWSPEFAKEYQLNSLPAHEETDPERCAEFIAFLLSEKDRHKYLHGCDLPYGL